MAGRSVGWALLVSALAACGGDDARHVDDSAGGGECDGTALCDALPTADAGKRDDAGRATTGSSIPSGSDAASTAQETDAGELAADAGAATRDGGAATGESKQSAGCGKAAPAGGNGKIDVKGVAREYILTLPKGYDPSKPYKLVFAWHGLGGTAAQIARGYYGLQTQAAEGTIFVAGQGLQTSNSVGSGPGWPNTNGQDVAFVKALYAELQGELCIDQTRVFSVGMSYGGIMSNTLGCQMGDVFRAIAPMSGSGPGYGARAASCVGEVAVWLSHGNTDTVVPTAQGQASRDSWIKANHCQSSSAAVEPSPCVAYAGCDQGLPVTWCEFDGGHTIPPFAARAIWTFFSQF